MITIVAHQQHQSKNLCKGFMRLNGTIILRTWFLLKSVVLHLFLFLRFWNKTKTTSDFNFIKKKNGRQTKLVVRPRVLNSCKILFVKDVTHTNTALSFTYNFSHCKFEFCLVWFFLSSCLPNNRTQQQSIFRFFKYRKIEKCFFFLRFL